VDSTVREAVKMLKKLGVQLHGFMSNQYQGKFYRPTAWSRASSASATTW
jgi:hypothetical protein